MALEYADELWDALYEAWDTRWEDRIERLTPMDEETTWENGLVLGLHLKLPPSDIADAIAPALSQFDAWAILNTRGEWIESVTEGPMSVYFNAFSTPGKAPPPTAQIFLGFDLIRHPEQAIDALRNVYRRDSCIPVLHFRDGRILLLRSSEPARLIRARMSGVARQIDCLCGCDASGESFSKDDRSVWEIDSIGDLSFGPPEDEGSD
jgi:hypothetical protein